MSTTTDSLTPTCVLCCQEIKIYAVGPCNHPICFKCSTKMRVICNQMYCEVCRTEMPKAIFTKMLRPFDGIFSHNFPNDRKSGILFATTRIQEEYRRILATECRICGIKREPDATFEELKVHMLNEHELFSCQLCVDNIKLLSSDRKFYTPKELVRHRCTGDQDDTSYRGHPMCAFCDERYFDIDALLRHLRTVHYFCNFCEETDGVTNEYYAGYGNLKKHFRSNHFLCEEEHCNCLDKTSVAVFRTELELKAHKAKCMAKMKRRSRQMTKNQATQTIYVDEEINLPTSKRDCQRRRRDVAYEGGARGGRNSYQRNREEREAKMAKEASLETAQKEEVKPKQKKSVISSGHMDDYCDDSECSGCDFD